MWVSPFRYPRIYAHLQLPEAFRSLSRLSSAPSAKAFALRPSSLDRFLLLDSSFANKMSFPEIVDSFKSLSLRQLPLPNLLSLRSFVQFSRYSAEKTFLPFGRKLGGLKWTRTTDLALIRRAL